ncbi:hypothetical protein HN51_062602, partial [Arachis hypogaea]
DVMLHDLDAANAQPQGGQELIDECKQWICWLRSIGTESIDEWCSSTRITLFYIMNSWKRDRLYHIIE